MERVDREGKPGRPPGVPNKPRFKKLTRQERIRIAWQLRQDGKSAQQIADSLGLKDRRSVFRYFAEYKDYVDELGPEPKQIEDITDEEVKACLEDTPDGFKKFFNRYFPQTRSALLGLQPHSEKIIRAAYDEEKGTWRDRVVINVPPRHAKSEVVSIWFVIWRFCLNRNIRILLISKSNMLASDFTNYITRQLETNTQLIQDFGRFKPASGEQLLWRVNQGEIDIAGRSPDIKERSLRARGSGEQLPGLGCDMLIADDVVTLANTSTVDQRNKLESWFQQEGLSRLDAPDNPAIVIGTRLNRDDLYGRLTQKKVVDPDDPDFEPEQVWTHISFPALFDPDTGLPSLSKEAEALWPAKWPRRSLLRTLGAEGSAIFNATYQQDPITDSERLILPAWIEGTGEHPGCLDYGRGVYKSPYNKSESVRVASIDPSPTKNAAAMLVDVLGRGDDFKAAVLDIECRRMGWQDMMDVLEKWNTYPGRIDYLVFEVNSFARWFVNDETIKLWCRAHNIRVIPHTTGRNKADTDIGFSAMAVAFEFGKIRLPYGDSTSKAITSGFSTEATNYTNPKDPNDQLMALWFIYNNYKKFVRNRSGGVKTKWNLPGWAGGAWSRG